MGRALRNPNGAGYRVPISKMGDFEVKKQQGEHFLFGELVDELGQYEELGTIKELTELKKRWGFATKK